MEALSSIDCQSLLNRFLSYGLPETPVSVRSEGSSKFESNYYDHQDATYELYIPTPQYLEGEQDSYLYHTATRNFFAWLCGKPLVGSHLGGALVGLLNSMNEFMPHRDDNVQEVLKYMDEQEYADLRNSPDHALALLFFAEHFHFKDLWIDSFAHLTGMHERLPACRGFEVRAP